MMPTVRALMTLTPVMDALVDAYRTGGGVSWDAYGTDSREAVGDSNRPIYLRVLPREWLPKIPEIHDRLRTAPPARVADIGCGTGWSSIAIAGAYPGVRVDGFDRDEESLAFARRNAETSGVADRVSFEARDAGEPGDAGAYDVVTFFECLHDMSRPGDALRVARGLLTGDGVVFVADEPTNDEFTGAGGRSRSVPLRMEPLRLPPDGDDRTRFGGHRHGDASIDAPLVCREAGFTGFDVLPIETIFRLYLLPATPRHSAFRRASHRRTGRLFDRAGHPM
jgi:SAM-dependent methyltransferase